MTNTLASLFYGSVLFLFLPLLPFVDATDMIQKVFVGERREDPNFDTEISYEIFLRQLILNTLH